MNFFTIKIRELDVAQDYEHLLELNRQVEFYGLCLKTFFVALFLFLIIHAAALIKLEQLNKK